MELRNRYSRSGELPDEDIIALYWQRREEAIHETDAKYGGYLYTVAHNILRDRADCEECQNDTYLNVWNAVPPERPVRFQAYLTQIIRRISLNRYKARCRQKRVPSELTVSLAEFENTAAENSTEEVYEAAELGRAISAFLRTLTEKQQYVFISRYYFADPVSEIARMCEVTESSVYKDLTVLRRRLSKFLEKEGFVL